MMVTLDDTSRSCQPTAPDDQAMAKRTDILQALKMAVGAFMSISAIGVWLVPFGDNQSAMLLIKLVFSLSLLCFGIMFISSMDRGDDEPELQFDPNARELRIVSFDEKGKPNAMTRHSLEDLSELSIQDGSLTARDAKGVAVVAVRIRDRKIERQIRKALGMA